jgi:hypothetical protein
VRLGLTSASILFINDDYKKVHVHLITLACFALVLSRTLTWECVSFFFTNTSVFAWKRLARSLKWKIIGEVSWQNFYLCMQFRLKHTAFDLKRTRKIVFIDMCSVFRFNSMYPIGFQLSYWNSGHLGIKFWKLLLRSIYQSYWSMELIERKYRSSSVEITRLCSNHPLPWPNLPPPIYDANKWLRLECDFIGMERPPLRCGFWWMHNLKI